VITITQDTSFLLVFIHIINKLLVFVNNGKFGSMKFVKSKQNQGVDFVYFDSFKFAKCKIFTAKNQSTSKKTLDCFNDFVYNKCICLLSEK